MNKNFFQDVVPPERRSIRKIPIMGTRRKRRVLPEEVSAGESSQPEEGEVVWGKNYLKPVFPKNKRRFFSGKVFITLTVVLVAVFIFGMMTAFTSASISIIPKKEITSFNIALKAGKGPALKNSPLKFEVINVKKEGQVEIPANGEEIAEKKAAGTITVYNDFSENPQRLIARTRFETPEGLIYRITESITIPGKTSTSPGLVETLVYADEAGEKYNIGKTDFTIPGFKSDNLRYKGFYAKSLTAMTGGFIGKVKKVNEADKKTAMKELEESMTTELAKEAKALLPEGFVALQGSGIFEFKDLGQVPGSGSKAVLKLEGTAHVIVFDEHSLSSIIAQEFLPDWSGMPLEIRSFDDMAVSFDPGFDAYADIISLRLTGTALIFAVINGVEVADSLKGMPKENLNDIMARFKGISSAKASIRPLWKNNFPENTARIHIKVE